MEVEDYFVKRSKHAALLSLNTMMGKLLYRSVSIAFRSWTSFCRSKEGEAQARIHMLTMAETQRRMEDDRNEVEKQRRENVAKKIFARLRNGCQTRVFAAWKSETTDQKHYRHVLGKFVGRMKNQKAMSALRCWVELVHRRKWVKGLLNRMLGGKDVRLISAAFRQWCSASNKSGE